MYMELRVNEVAIPEEIKVLNFEELKAELKDKAEYYGSLLYTDEQIKDAKADRAMLNKFKNTANSERIRKEKEYMNPFNQFKSQINELIAIVDKPIAVIDERIAAYNDEQKAQKKKAIEELFAGMGFQSFVTLEKIWDPKWLNASTSMKSIEEQMRARMYQIGDDVYTLSQLPEFGFEATEVFKQTLDINKAISEAKRMSEIVKAKADAEAKKKAAEESRKAEEERKAKEIKEEQTVPHEQAVTPQEPVQSADSTQERMVVRFEVLLTTEDAYALKEFFKSRSIEFKAI
ncbi:DUF1351 domain-containing protein [Clostridium sp. AM46-21]|nr:DUF1351 domain-containing protein [Clostridium sp. AM46-21]